MCTGPPFSRARSRRLRGTDGSKYEKEYVAKQHAPDTTILVQKESGIFRALSRGLIENDEMATLYMRRFSSTFGMKSVLVNHYEYKFEKEKTRAAI